MTIYILRAYRTAHKWQGDDTTIGYFTNKATLRKAIKLHAGMLGLFNEKDFWRAFERGDRWTIGACLETGEIEQVAANEIYELDE